MSKVSPLTIRIMFAIYCAPNDVEQFVPENQWLSGAGDEARTYLLSNELVKRDENSILRATDRGKAWVQYICETPFPIPVWKMPEREDRCMPAST